MALNPRIRIDKVKSDWGNVSWEAYVDDQFVCRCRLRKEAVEVAEARIRRLDREALTWVEDMELEFGDDL